MGKVHEAITPDVRAFIEAQKMFFVATAPLCGDGLINLSPKGLDGTLRVLDEQRVAYCDLTGSGVETIAHVKQNARIVLMFCAFEGKPKILRIYGKGDVFERGSADYETLMPRFPELSSLHAARSIIQVTATRIADSCGFGVPEYEFKGHRDLLHSWAEKRGEAGMRDYRRDRNAESLDGLPGVESGR